MHINYTNFFLGIFIGFLSASVSFAQPSRLYSSEEGLPSSHIQQLMFDPHDYLWVATDLGLSRFNGERFTNFQAEYQVPYRLQENQINSLYIDRDGQYWVAGSDGLYLFNSTLNSFTRYSLSTTRQDISVSSIIDHPFRDHTLILASYGWGFRVFDTQTCAFDSVAASDLQHLVNVPPDRLHVDHQGRMWGFASSEINVIDLKTMTNQRLSTRNPDVANGRFNVGFVVEDEENECLYLGAGGRGVVKVDLNTLSMQPLPLPVTDVTALEISPKNILYIGTETSGLWRYDPSTEEVKRYTSSNLSRFGSEKIHSIAFDSNENLWLGLYQKGVVMLPYRDNSIFKRQIVSFFPDAGPNMASVTGFAALPDGSKAYALDGAGVVVDYADGQREIYSMRNTCMATDAVISLASMPNGTLLAGTYQHGIYFISPDHKVSRDPRFASLDNASVTDFEHDPQKNILYIATNGHGLFVFNYQTNEITSPIPDYYGIKWINNIFLSDRNNRLWLSRADHLSCLDIVTGEIVAPKQPKSRVVINGFAETTDGEMWLASNYGLLHYDNSLDSLVLIEESEQMQRRNYSALMCSDDGRLWIASSGCITMYDTLQHRFVDYLDPVISSVGTINYHSSKRWPDQTYSFGGDNGVINFRPDEVDSFRHPSHHLQFTSLWVDNVPTDYDPILGTDNVLDKALWCAQKLTLPSNRASFSVSFTIHDVSGEAGIAYSYRLKGYENEWHQSHGGSKIANYHSLPSGDYVLEVCARHENDMTGDEAVIRQLSVCILPPWYATWWAMLIWVAFFAVICMFSIKQVLEHRHARNELREAETQRQLKEGKLNLLTSVSHEIKTPLTLIISPLRKMMSRKTDPATQSVLEMMYRNSLRILMLVNQQMDLRKLDKGELQLHVSELPLRSFLDDLMQYFSSMALSRHIAYNLILPEDRDDMTIWADPTQLDKVVMNLLSNAIKFVPDDGRVIVEVSSIEDNKTRISVYNSGSQLPEGQQSAAFNGIGLSIAREISELHHGSLTVRNLEDGVSFDIDLLPGNAHFTPEELAKSSKSEVAFERKVPAIDGNDVIEGERLEVVSSSTVEEEDKEHELVEQLNNELREKQRLRERRSSLDASSAEPVKMSSADEKLMRRVMDLIHKNMGASDFSVESLSEELGISRVHLNRKLKELLDISPSALIKSVRLKQAALLLIQSNVTVAEVAYSVGFSSPAYFTTNFTQYYGMTPKEFINMYTENPDAPELNHLLGK